LPASITRQPIGTAVAGYGSGSHKLDLWVSEDLVEGPSDLRLRVFGEEGGDLFLVGIVDPL
jgi:hypothetical protein